MRQSDVPVAIAIHIARRIDRDARVPIVDRRVANTIAIPTQRGVKAIGRIIFPRLPLQFRLQVVRMLRLQGTVSLHDVQRVERIVLLDQVGGIINGTLSVFSWGFVFLVGLVYFVFILLDFENLGRGFIGLFPKSLRPTVKTITADLDRYMNSYFRGQALVAMSVGLLLSIGFNIIGLPLATAMGIFIGILNFIPYMQALGVIPLGLVSVLMGAQTGENVFVCMLLAYGVLMIVQVIQDMILVPRIMGQTMGMRPSLILLVLSIWGYLLGFFGMLIALPLTMFIYSIYMRYVLQDEDYIEKMRLQEEKREAKRNRHKKSQTPKVEASTSPVEQ